MKLEFEIELRNDDMFENYYDDWRLDNGEDSRDITNDVSESAPKDENTRRSRSDTDILKQPTGSSWCRDSYRIE